MNLKRQRERLYLEAFLGQIGWHHHRIAWGPDPPDFLLETGDEIIAVEMTQLYKDEGLRGSPVKAAEGERAKFLRQLASEYYAQGGRPLLVKAMVPGIPDPRAVAALAARLHECRPTVAWDTTEFEAKVGGLEHARFYLRALPDEQARYSRWECITDAVGWVRPLSVELIAERIQEKAEKLQEYLKAADRVMLLLVADRLLNSGKLEFAPTGTRLPTCGFSEVHLLMFPLRTYQVA